MIIITFLILKNKYSWNTCCLVFYSNEKFETFKKVLHSAAFHWSWFSYYLEEICIYQLIFSRFVFTIVQYVLRLIMHSCLGKKRDHYKITVRWSITIIHRYYQWKLIKSDLFYFETGTILNNDFDVSRCFSQRIFEDMPVNHEIWER